MSERTTNAQVSAYAENLRKHHGVNVKFERSRPGDGVTRYHFTICTKDGQVDSLCLGAREAYVYLKGVDAGVMVSVAQGH